MASSDLAICNAALAEVPADEIADLGENSREAQECTRSYGPAKAYLLGRPERGWTFARGMEALAPVDNDRATQWAYAYALPTGKEVLRVVAIPETLGDPAPSYALTAYGTPSDRDPPYEVAGSTIYTDVEDAYLVFRLTDASEALFPPYFVRALELEVAQRICLPLTKDKARKRELVVAANIELDRAMAADLNRTPQRYAEHIPDHLAARL